MGRKNRNPLGEKILVISMESKTIKRGWRLFLEKCLSIDDSKELDAYFELFLTPTERQEIAGRYLIVQELLKREKTQRQIAEDLKVSIANISRGSNILKMTGSDLKKLLKDNS